jgi:hypothetical protein
MKVWLQLGLSVLSCVVSFAQGQIVFANKIGTLDAPVTLSATLAGPGPDWTAQLNLQGVNGSLTPLTPTSTFFAAGTGGDPNADRYWAPQTVEVPGVPPGQPATFVVRAWLTSVGSYDAAVSTLSATQSAPFTVTLGGDPFGRAAIPTTLKAFMVTYVPEPSMLSLAGLGVCVLALRKLRRSSRSKEQARQRAHHLATLRARQPCSSKPPLACPEAVFVAPTQSKSEGG